MVNPDIRINSQPIRSTSSSDSGRPTGSPSGSKSFEKVMGRDERGGQEQQKEGKLGKKDNEEEGKNLEDSEEQAPVKEKPAGLFDLSRGTKPKQPPPMQAFTFEAALEEPPAEENLVGMAENNLLAGKEKGKKFDDAPKTAVTKQGLSQGEAKEEGDVNSNAIENASAQTSVKERNAKPSGREQDLQSSDNPDNMVGQMEAHGEGLKRTEKSKTRGAFELASEKHEESKNRAGRSEFSKEQGDSAYINPLTQGQQQAPLVNPMTDAKPAQVPQNQKAMKELVDQIVKEMYVVKTGDVTDTVITIRHPPIFEGAQVKITSFESARGEFNIAFENLTQQAKDLLDNKLNRESLMLALNKEGYNVHIFTTTTNAAENPYTALEAEKKDQEQRQGQGREQQEQEKEKQKKK